MCIRDSLRLDLKGIYYMPTVIRAAKIGDAAIIKSIIKILNNEGIKVLSSIYFNPELSLKKGNFSKIKPNKQDQIDIKKGVDVEFKNMKKGYWIAKANVVFPEKQQAYGKLAEEVLKKYNGKIVTAPVRIKNNDVLKSILKILFSFCQNKYTK